MIPHTFCPIPVSIITGHFLETLRLKYYTPARDRTCKIISLPPLSMPDSRKDIWNGPETHVPKQKRKELRLCVCYARNPTQRRDRNAWVCIHEMKVKQKRNHACSIYLRNRRRLTLFPIQTTVIIFICPLMSLSLPLIEPPEKLVLLVVLRSRGLRCCTGELDGG